jgi:hypothetical protein
MSLSPLLAPRTAIAVLTLLTGCGGTPDAAPDMGDVPVEPRCDGPYVRYRITELHVPTPAEAGANTPVGHNVDASADACGVPDFDGGVDNALIDLSSALHSFIPPDEGPDLQAAIDAGLGCAIDAAPSECTRLDLIVSLDTEAGCSLIEIEDGAGTSLAGPFGGTIDASGHLRGVVTAGLSLTVALPAAGGPVDVTLDIRHMIFTAVVGADALTNIVLGGAIERSTFEAMLMEVLPLLGDEPSFDDLEPILANLYDVEVDGQCTALSVGFTGSATLVAAP